MIDFRRILAVDPAAEAVVRGWVLGALAAAFVVVLSAGAWDAHHRNARVLRDLQEAEADLARVRAESDRLKAELRALNEDPVYVEGVLRWMQAAAVSVPGTQPLR